MSIKVNIIPTFRHSYTQEKRTSSSRTLPSSQHRSGCVPDPCSIPDICPANARCENNNGRPLCTCEPGFVGDGFQECFRGDCISNDDCSASQSCKDYRCVDPCSFSCGNGADCEPRNHVAICRCPKGFTGDPFQVSTVRVYSVSRRELKKQYRF